MAEGHIAPVPFLKMRTLPRHLVGNLTGWRISVGKLPGTCVGTLQVLPKTTICRNFAYASLEGVNAVFSLFVIHKNLARTQNTRTSSFLNFSSHSKKRREEKLNTTTVPTHLLSSSSMPSPAIEPSASAHSCRTMSLSPVSLSRSSSGSRPTPLWTWPST